MMKIYIDAEKLIMIIIGVPILVYVFIAVVMDRIGRRRRK